MNLRQLVILWTMTLCGFSVHASWYDDWSAKPAWPEPYSFAAGTALTLTSLTFRRFMVDDLQAYESTHKPLGNWSKFGDISGQGLPNALYAGGMGIAAWAGESGALDHTELMITATAEAVLITTVAKYSIREKRPDSSNRDSFPSGHTTSAFAFASVVGAEHGWAWGVPAYALAGFVGWSRINDNKHFLHDVLAGATVGTSTGLGVYYARERRRGKSSTASNFQIFPVVLADGGEMMVQAAF
jgi:hypothetical protein